MAITILDQVKVLDEEIAAARPVAEEGANLGARYVVDLAAPSLDPRLSLARPRMAKPA
jgi:hypothetical protein